MLDRRPMKRLLTWAFALPAACLAVSLAAAQIERLDLDQMVAKTDNAVHGRIVASEVVRIDHPVDGPQNYFTHLTIEGVSLFDGQPTTVTVTFPGGFISPEQGVHNSEAPTADEIRLGNDVVAFYKWTENMGAGLAGNALYASHGGIYRVAETRKGQVVLGKGDGYAIASNVRATDLSQQIAAKRVK
jgi:hypothetical protein